MSHIDYVRVSHVFLLFFYTTHKSEADPQIWLTTAEIINEIASFMKNECIS